MRRVKFDAIRVGELTVNFMEAPAVVSAKAAFVSQRSGTTHGWTTCRQFSPDTIEKLRELRLLMERDIGRIHFTDDDEALSETTTTDGGGKGQPSQGLGEYFGPGEDPVPQG